jgi:uncharacterized protein (DUF433 family)
MVVLTGISSNLRKGILALASRVQAGRPVVAVPPQRQVQTRLTDAEVARLITAYQAGTKISQLAVDFGINRNTVSSILRSSGIELRRRGLPAGSVAEVAALYLAGWSLTGIGDHFGCTAETVRQALHQAGVHRRKPWDRAELPTTVPQL